MFNLPNLKGLPSALFSNKKHQTDFDSILPLNNKSSSGKQSSLVGYLYNTSVSIGSVISGSCQTSFCYVADVAGSIVKYGRSSNKGFLPKTQQDTQNQYNSSIFNKPNTPITAPIVATNEPATTKWMPIISTQEPVLKTPKPSNSLY